LRAGANGEEPTDIPFSRLILAAQSPVFRGMFYGTMVEAKADAIVQVQFPVQAVQAFLDGICCGKVEVNDSIAVDLHLMADFYQIDALKRVVTNYIREHLNAERALKFFSNAGMGDLRRILLDYIQTHAAECLAGSRVENLTFDTLSVLLPLDLRIGELELFKAVMRWGKAQGDERESITTLQHRLAPLFEHVRFPLMQEHELAEDVEPTGLVSQDLLYEALLGKVKRVTPSGIRFQKRIQALRLHFPELDESGMSYSDSAEADKHGLFYHLGTKGGTCEYRNPCTDKIVSVTWSSLQVGGEHLFVGLQHPDTNSYTAHILGQFSWMQVDLGRCCFIPNRYAIRDGFITSNERVSSVLKDWNLEARGEETEPWTVLTTHINDSTLKTKVVASWEILNCHTAFRFFRLHMTGPNHSGYHNLLCSGFELWGDLLLEPKVVAS